jgi:hypothetical protein
VALFKLGANAEVELLTQAELNASLQASEQRQRQPYQAISFMRLPVINGVAVAGALSMGGDVNPEHTPAMGYAWSLRHLAIIGLTRGASPDAVRILRGQLAIWELNGNQSFQTWGRGEIMINEGETLAYQNIGTFAATGQIIIHGMAWQAPAQLTAELVT